MPARSLGRAEPALLPSCFICGGGRQQVKVMGCSKYKNKKNKKIGEKAREKLKRKARDKLKKNLSIKKS
jgi:hypothetical protein